MARVLRRFPDPAALRSRSAGRRGAGVAGPRVPARAGNLHAPRRRDGRAGTTGRFPRRSTLLALPGVGPYTARAVLAFAFERDVGVVDTNIARVLARSWASADRPVGAGAGRRGLPPARLGVEPVLMDLGATVCRPAVPECEACPLAAACGWAAMAGGDDRPGLQRRQRPPGAVRGQSIGRLAAV